MVTTYQSKHAISQKTWIFNYDIWRSWFLWASAQDIEKAEHLEELAGVCWFQLGKNCAKFHRDSACWKLLVTTHQLTVTKLPKLRHAMNNVFARCDTYVSKIKTFAAPHENMISKTLILTAQHWTKTHGPQLVAHMNSDKCLTAHLHTKESDWRRMCQSDKIMCLYC
jgi:hypothetical protein